MENNDNTVEETTDTTDVEETNDTEETNSGQKEDKDWQAEAAKWKAIAERKDKKSETKETKASNDLPNRDDIRIMAKMSDEEIDQLEIISKATGSSLKEASENPMFKSFQKDLQAKARSEKAQLGTSGGSKAKQAPNIEKMTRDEHREYAMKLING